MLLNVARLRFDRLIHEGSGRSDHTAGMNVQRKHSELKRSKQSMYIILVALR